MDLKFKWLDFATVSKPSVVPMVKQITVDEPVGVVLLELHQGEFGLLVMKFQLMQPEDKHISFSLSIKDESHNFQAHISKHWPLVFFVHS